MSIENGARLSNQIQNIKEFKEDFEGLKVVPNLIAIDGPDGAGKTKISEKVVKFLKEKTGKEVLYVKTRRYLDTNSQIKLRKIIIDSDVKYGNDPTKFDHIYGPWSARVNRSYGDHILNNLWKDTIIVLDKSEADIFRGAIESAKPEILKKIEEFYKSGSLTHGITAGNRVFIKASPSDLWSNLEPRQEKLTGNDPKNLDEAKRRLESSEEAQRLLQEMHSENVNFIEVENPRIEGEDAIEKQTDQIARTIVSKLKLKL